jgi:hypothetical protein
MGKTALGSLVGETSGDALRIFNTEDELLSTTFSNDMM